MDTKVVASTVSAPQSGTVTGDAWSLVHTNTSRSRSRMTLEICHDPSGAAPGTFLYIAKTDSAGAAPTLAATEVVRVLGSRQTLTTEINGGIKVYGMNSTGAATTTNFTSQESL